MTISISSQFQKLAAKIYIFSILFIALRFLPVESVSTQGIKIDLSEPGILTGALSLATGVLTIAAILSLARDFISTLVVDQIGSKELMELKSTDFIKETSAENTFLEKHYWWYAVITWTVFLIEGLFPIFLGIWTVLVGYQDVVLFFVEITT